MSFEGFYQCVCKNRHYTDVAFDPNEEIENFLCDECGDELVWTNLVDDTNLDEFGFVEIEQKDGLVTLEQMKKLSV